jgi:hypothetical protein
MSTQDVVREAQTQAEYNPLAKQKAAAKLSRIPIKVEQGEILKKPEWIRVKAGSPSTRFYEIKQILRESNLHTVCEEASCPNIGECFGKGTATFMIMGDKCTRRCPFCDVGHGRPDPLDVNEPESSNTSSSPRLTATTCATAVQVILWNASAKPASCLPAPRLKCWCRTLEAAMIAR